MDTLIIYDGAGVVIAVASGNVREPVNVPFIWVNVPAGQYVASVDPVTNTPVFADIPKTETQALQDQVDALNIAMAQLIGG